MENSTLNLTSYKANTNIDTLYSKDIAINLANFLKENNLKYLNTIAAQTSSSSVTNSFNNYKIN
jgi:hypothetical protein